MSEPVIDRVRKVMNAASVSQAAFAEKIGLTPDKLSKSLTGVRRFTALDLALIAEAGEKTVDWLLTGREPLRPTGAARTGAATVPDRDSIEEVTGRFTSAYEVLELLGRPLSLPAMPSVREDVHRFVDQGERLAEDALARLRAAGVTSVAGLEADALVAACEQCFGVDVATTALPGGLDGLAWQADGFRLALVHRTKVWTRQRFTLAHELGHILARDAQELITEAQVAPGRQQDMTEVRANVFAASLLMPTQEIEGAFRAAVPGDSDQRSADDVFKQLVVRFKVSPSALAARLHRLGLIDAEARNRLRGLTTETCHLFTGAMDEYQRQESLAKAEHLPSRLLSALFAAYREGETTLRPLAALLGKDDDELHRLLDPAMGESSVTATDTEEGDLVFQP